jgi:hypothetical protein
MKYLEEKISDLDTELVFNNYISFRLVTQICWDNALTIAIGI